MFRLPGRQVIQYRTVRPVVALAASRKRLQRVAHFGQLVRRREAVVCAARPHQFLRHLPVARRALAEAGDHVVEAALELAELGAVVQAVVVRVGIEGVDQAVTVSVVGGIDLVAVAIGIGLGAVIHGWAPEDFFTRYAGPGASDERNLHALIAAIITVATTFAVSAAGYNITDFFPG